MILGNKTNYQNAPYYEGTGDGTAGALTLSWQPASSSALYIFIGGVPQSPARFTVSGFTLTPLDAIPSGAKILVFGAGVRGVIQQPAAGSVTPETLGGFNALGDYADDAAAATGGVAIGGMYRNGSVVMVRVA